jgi:hypothetical protein
MLRDADVENVAQVFWKSTLPDGAGSLYASSPERFKGLKGCV